MEMDFLPDLLTAVEWATVIVTFIMMASGIPLYVTMYKKRSTTDVPYLLFLVYALVGTLSLHYGILINNKTLILINVVAVLVWGTYVSTYIFVSKSKVIPFLKLLAVVGVYAAQFYHLKTVSSVDVIPVLGSYLLFWCMIMCIVPAQDIVSIIREKSTSCCNLPLFFGGTLCASVWYLYGILMNDANIYFPNMSALFISAIKFILMLVYGFPPKQTNREISSAAGINNTDFHNSILKFNTKNK